MRSTTARMIFAWILLATCSSASADEPVRQPDVQAAIAKATPLLLKGAKGHVEQRSCFACHNQALPMLATTTLRDRGFSVPENDLREQTEFIAKFLDKNRELYRQGTGQGGQVDTASYALYTLELGGWKPDATTGAVVEYLLQRDQDRDHWRTVSQRPPSEASDFTTTALAIRALREWGTTEQRDRIENGIAAARDWVLKTPARDTEDRVFRLWALQLVEASTEDRLQAACDLLQAQRDDGGWAQTDELESDAYATGSALVVLHLTGNLATTDPVYQRGVEFLLRTQLDDGSWHVVSRSKPFQAYFESGFPHGKDQFISIAASGWATTALALACPPKAPLPVTESPKPK